jgi:endoglucanase
MGVLRLSADVLRRSLSRAGATGGRTAFVLAALALFCGGRAVTAQPAFPLHTSGRFIVDSNGTRVRLNGVNWYGAESTDYVVAGLQTATLQSIVQEIKSLGFNVVRLPWSNQLYESNPVVGNYALTANPGMEGEHALTILDQVISALTDAGIMVILDNHNSDAEWCCSTSDGNSLWYNSNYPQANWVSDWEGIAQRYAGNPMVIGADLRNEPRSPATWGGSAGTDWHATAELGGNAVLGVNPHLLIFVEGVNYALDLSGAQSLPVQLSVPNQLVYEAHNYGFDYGNVSGYSNFMSTIAPNWGYLVTGSNPQPLWIGEFGTCYTASTCIDSSNSSDGGYWFNMLTAFMQQYGLDWTYWAINGTQSTGSGRNYGAAETYGILNTAWSGPSSATLMTRMQSIMNNAPPGITLVGNGSAMTVSPGVTGTATVAIVPGNGFTGTVNLTCSVSGPAGTANAPACGVPSTETISGTSEADFVVSVKTSGATATAVPVHGWKIGASGGGTMLACVLLLMCGLGKRSRAVLPLLLAIAIGLPLWACGGDGGGGSNPGTTAGAYTVTVNATGAGGASSSLQIAVNVQ